MALHAAIAWSAYTHTGAVGWLLIGMFYGMGEYVFVAGAIGTRRGRENDGVSARTARSRGSWEPFGSSATPTCDGISGSSSRRAVDWTRPSSVTPLIIRHRRLLGGRGRQCAVPESRVSVLILAKNEAHNLPACLDTVNWANEVIVVVDRASRDDTQAIASTKADLVAVRTFDDFANQRNSALALASGDWVFAIDADERNPGTGRRNTPRHVRPELISSWVSRADSKRHPRPSLSLFRDAIRPPVALFRRSWAVGSAPSMRPWNSTAPPVVSKTPCNIELFLTCRHSFVN